MSSRTPVSRSISFFTVDLLFWEWMERLNRGKLGLKSVETALGAKLSGVVKLEK
jgi:hypothetical protein